MNQQGEWCLAQAALNITHLKWADKHWPPGPLQDQGVSIVPCWSWKVQSAIYHVIFLSLFLSVYKCVCVCAFACECVSVSPSQTLHPSVEFDSAKILSFTRHYCPMLNGKAEGDKSCFLSRILILSFTFSLCSHRLFKFSFYVDCAFEKCYDYLLTSANSKSLFHHFYDNTCTCIICVCTNFTASNKTGLYWKINAPSRCRWIRGQLLPFTRFFLSALWHPACVYS